MNATTMINTRIVTRVPVRQKAHAINDVINSNSNTVAEYARGRAS
jgi:hypothetical protein